MIPSLRSVGGFLRGDSTPFQIFSTTILASIIGFLPGFQQAPGMMLAGFLLLLIVNTNLFLAGIVGSIARLLGLALQPVSFGVGRWLIDGPLSSLFTSLINGPVTAWFGFENYVASGGLLLGAVFGLVAGIVFSGIIAGFRKRMAALESVETFQKASNFWLSRFFGWIFFGGLKGKEDWETMNQRKIGKPVRFIGIGIAVVVIGLLVASPYLISNTWLASVVRNQVEPLNGATVDLEAVDLDLASGKLAVETLALCDPNELKQNLFQSVRLEASLSESDLLSRKYAIDRLEVSGAKINEMREQPGKRIGPKPEPSADPDLPDPTQEDEDERTFSIEGAVDKADELKAHLAELKKWLGKISGGKEEDAGIDGEGETLEERLERLAKELGYAQVIASHRIADKPRFTIHELVVNDVTVRQMPGETLNVLGTDLSTEAHLVEGASTLQVTSDSDRLGLALTIDKDSGPLTFHYRELPTETVKGWLKKDSKFPFSGGHFNIEANGTLTGGEVHLPLQVTAVGSQLQLGGRTFNAPEVPFTVLISGALDNPRIRPQLKELLRGAKGQLLEEGKSKVRDKINEKLGDRFNGILGGGSEEDGESGMDKAGSALDSFLQRRKEKKEGK